MDMFRKKKKSGFTLVELLVVLVIIGIIVAIILPNTLRAIDQAERRDTAGVLRAITNACFLCYSTNQAWSACNSLGALTAANPPSGPYLDSGTVNANFRTFSDGDQSTLTLTGDDTVGYQANYQAHFPNWPKLQ